MDPMNNGMGHASGDMPMNQPMDVQQELVERPYEYGAEDEEPEQRGAPEQQRFEAEGEAASDQEMRYHDDQEEAEYAGEGEEPEAQQDDQPIYEEQQYGEQEEAEAAQEEEGEEEVAQDEGVQEESDEDFDADAHQPADYPLHNHDFDGQKGKAFP